MKEKLISIVTPTKNEAQSEKLSLEIKNTFENLGIN